jgi:hypothetical protein
MRMQNSFEKSTLSLPFIFLSLSVCLAYVHIRTSGRPHRRTQLPLEGVLQLYMWISSKETCRLNARLIEI